MSQEPTLQELVSPLRQLVEKLILEHHTFADQNEVLVRTAADSDMVTPEMYQLLSSLRDGLMQHIVEEESKIYPDLKRRNQFDNLVAMIMQQHEELKASLRQIEAALDARDTEALRDALTLFTEILSVHQPAEEDVVFPMVE